MNPKKYYVHVLSPPIPGHIAKEGKNATTNHTTKIPRSFKFNRGAASFCVCHSFILAISLYKLPPGNCFATAPSLFISVLRHRYRLRKIQKTPQKPLDNVFLRSFPMEAPPRFELGIKVLQTSALPLGYGAG